MGFNLKFEKLMIEKMGVKSNTRIVLGCFFSAEGF